ncbi:hypothetical protein SD81_040615 [Tolypothrix campylonemoides VB511288]|nr:hypothetical protein SD81_040615 [Tolypothrix campylonemoides VB511288]
MIILIANIGTSDLAVKIDGFNYYLPIFERREPNEDISGLTTDELEIWHNRNSYTELLCDELNVCVSKSPRTGEPEFSFIEFSEKLLQTYLSKPDTWHSRIRPGRIGGVIIDAKNKFTLDKIHLFVTNQKPQHKLDTIYLFEILKHWFKREYEIQLIAEEIPIKITAKESDDLLDYYYKFFHKNISSDDTVIVSIKGGTPQMHTALKMQAIASSVSRLMFIDPQFSISKTLTGEFSDCKLTSYWQYMRTQKYQTVKLLLDENRWDFNGAIQILLDWNEVLNFFIKHNVIDSQDIADSNAVISRVISTLSIGIACFNLDSDAAKQILRSNSKQQLSIRLVNEVQNYDKVLNLYTQCRILWKLNQVANFLARMSSFYEVILEKLAIYLNCEESFKKFNNRFDKRKLIDQQVCSRNLPQELQAWQEILNLLKSFDYWCTHRNKLIHGAKGVSKARTQELFDQEYQENPLICQPDDILRNMGKILSSSIPIVKNGYRYKFIGDNNEHYIYSEVKDWVIKTLINDGLH